MPPVCLWALKPHICREKLPEEYLPSCSRFTKVDLAFADYLSPIRPRSVFRDDIYTQSRKGFSRISNVHLDFVKVKLDKLKFFEQHGD